MTLRLLPVAFDLAGPAAHTCPRDSALTGGGRLFGRRLSGAVEAGNLDLCNAVGIAGLQGRHCRSVSSERSDLGSYNEFASSDEAPSSDEGTLIGWHKRPVMGDADWRDEMPVRDLRCRRLIVHGDRSTAPEHTRYLGPCASGTVTWGGQTRGPREGWRRMDRRANGGRAVDAGQGGLGRPWP